MTGIMMFGAGSMSRAAGVASDALFAYRTNNSTARSNTTTLLDDIDLSFNVRANTWYAYEAYIRSDVSSTTSPPNILLQMNYPGTALGNVFYYGLGEGGTSASGVEALNNNGQVGRPWDTTVEITGSNVNNVGDQTAIIGHGLFQSDQSGSFVLQWAPSVSTAVTLRLEIGSWMSMTALE